MSLTKFLRKNMNKFLWVLVIFIAVAFGVTSTMTDVFQNWFIKPVGKVFGRSVGIVEFTNISKRLQRGQERGNVSDEDIMKQIAKKEEAKNNGIKISSEELSDAVLENYRMMKLRDDIMSSSNTKEEKEKRFSEFWSLPEHIRKQKLENMEFTYDEYARLLSKYFGYSISEYESLMSEYLLQSRLESLIRDCAKVTTKKLYEDFIEQNHERKIEYSAVHGNSFEDKVEVLEDKLKEYYEITKNRYMEPEKIAFEYLLVRFDKVKEQIPNPAEEELKSFYQKMRHTYFRRPEREIPQPPKPDDVYKPYEEIRTEVIRRFIDDKANEQIKKLLTDVKEELDKHEELLFEKVIEIAKNFELEAKETKLFSQEDAEALLRTEFGSCPEVAAMFSRKDQIPELAKGKYSDAVTCDTGIFIYRPAKLQEKKPSPFEKVKSEVEKAYINNEASKLAQKTADELAKEIKEKKNIPLDTLLQYNTYKVTTDFFKTPEK
ncbi:MAG: hypothetical protein ABIH42_01685, partial [Planctomycetota bacterium]